MDANFKSQAIVVQMHIPEFDVQGRLTSDDKLEMLEISIKHLRMMNEHTTIILCGHGCTKPTKETYECCERVIWNTPCLPLDKRGCVIGQPAQFKSVFEGIRYAAQDIGFHNILKTRGDCIIGLPNICNRMDYILEEEGRDLMLTQQTASKRFKMGDCFMYGDSGVLMDIWNSKNPVQCEEDGVVNTGMNWIRHHLELNPSEVSEYEWGQLLKYHCSFRDVYNLRFVDLRHNWHELKYKKQEILEKKLNYKDWIWGVTNGWSHFDEKGNDEICFDGTCYTMNTFYNG